MTNPVVLAVILMLSLSILRVNVVIALSISAIAGGLIAGMGLVETINVFQNGLGNGATIALSYAMLGTFAVAVSRSGITDLLANSIIKWIDKKENSINSNKLATNSVKYIILTIILLLGISSQNVVPIHIAFIPIIIPPLLHVFNKLQLDRRMIVCVITFGLVTTYMVLPVGFGGIYLNEVLLANLQSNGLTSISANDIPVAMSIPALGMVTGLIIAVFFSYRKPRIYPKTMQLATTENIKITVNKLHLLVAVLAIICVLVIQLHTDSMIIGALFGFIIFVLGGVIGVRETQDVFTKGIHMMAMIGFIMISAAGFAAVMKASGGVDSLVLSLTNNIGDNKSLAALLMLIVGLLVTMGIGSSFSTVPILAAIYVPLSIQFGFSPMATIALVGTAGALGDAGSPVSDSTLGPTSGLNVDGKHDHIWDSVVPTFIHFNIPLIIFGWIAAMTL